MRRSNATRRGSFVSPVASVIPHPLIAATLLILLAKSSPDVSRGRGQMGNPGLAPRSPQPQPPSGEGRDLAQVLSLRQEDGGDREAEAVAVGEGQGEGDGGLGQ